MKSRIYGMLILLFAAQMILAQKTKTGMKDCSPAIAFCSKCAGNEIGNKCAMWCGN